MNHGGKRHGAGRPKGQGPHGETTKPLRIPLSLLADIKTFIAHRGYRLPLYTSKVAAGFPSPADDHVDSKLDLNEHLIKHPAATFFVRAAGDSMINAGIYHNDLLIVDRSMEAMHGRIVIAVINGELTVKRLHKKNRRILLLPENDKYPPIEIPSAAELHIWGVVTNVIHAV